MKGSLYHWGILGMKWGVRRFQNKDGSLTAEGRRRYNVSSKQIDNDYRETKNAHQEEYNRIKTNGQKIIEQADALGEEYKKAYQQLQMSQEQKQKIVDSMRQDFDQLDADSFEMMKYDYIDTAVDELAEQIVGNKRKEFDKLQEDYWNDVHTIVGGLLEKYKDTNVYDATTYYKDGQTYVNNMISSDMDTSYKSYISRHFDDYWVGDTDARYEAIDRITSEIESMMDFKKPRDWRREIMS